MKKFEVMVIEKLVKELVIEGIRENNNKEKGRLRLEALSEKLWEDYQVKFNLKDDYLDDMEQLNDKIGFLKVFYETYKVNYAVR